ncbi:uncharacterized protein LOC130629626 [Hydractinia symbiolongicarpus]|uniref:uncharacterized protein LOC130629626 n=1 Tax=Hydractinia symbiolongicarpus TaxID=13093 RepID=UPI00254F8C84|nr:uncharacterized protein LOC130629626 [Hydractinia symbiolongicarpus]XP_057298878.1 uncharacterized protein LOC130629626 [Hydractinia symbiolongicarpus]
MDLKEAFDSAMEHKSPVKITTVVTRPNKFSNELMDLEVTRDSNVEPTDASFELKPMTVQSVDVTVKEIKGGNHVNQLVNVKGYLTVEDRPTTLITTKYSVEPILMKTAIINDENDNMFVELWGSFATNVTTNGSYVLRNLRLKEWPTGLFKLSTQGVSKVVASDEIFAPCNDDVANIDFQIADFPPMSIESISRKLACPKCRKTSQDNHSTLFIC